MAHASWCGSSRPWGAVAISWQSGFFFKGPVHRHWSQFGASLAQFEEQNQHATIQDVSENSVCCTFFSDVSLGDRFHSSGLSFCFRSEFECNTSMTKLQRSSAGIPSIRNPASREIIQASVELCDTHVCFLRIQLIGTNVWLPNTHNVPPEVDFESSRFVPLECQKARDPTPKLKSLSAARFVNGSTRRDLLWGFVPHF